ncbi:MAG: spore germination protein [Peptococcaceae bacterium]|nr:spore germination protein [Peptococcaceae bacterium]
MLKYLAKVFSNPPKQQNTENQGPPPTPLEKDLRTNITQIRNRLRECSDIIYYEFIDPAQNKGLLSYINGFVDSDLLNRDIVTPLLTKTNPDKKNLLYTSLISSISTLEEAVNGILEGNVLLIMNEETTAFLLSIRKQVQRSIEEPDSESVVRGSKEGFVESVKTNIILLRKRIKSPNLKIQTLKIGRITQTEVAVVYIDGIVDPDVLKEVRRRLNKINTDSILETGYIEQYIQDRKYSPYPTIGITEKPDVVAGKILEGRVAIFCDGTPHVLTVPLLYIENLQTSEDYYVRTLNASFLRLLRLLGLIISTLLPGLYVALSTYHQEMIPTVLLISIAGAREGVPLPALAEALLMGIMFELLKESGTRLPRAIGSAISIVGALVIGEAAVDAGLVSAPLVIVTATTAVASFIIPPFTETMTIFRLLFTFLGGIMGLIGITCGIFLVMVYTVSLRSFGVPYTAPLSPGSVNNLKDTFLRFPLSSMKNRPPILAGKNTKRRGGK